MEINKKLEAVRLKIKKGDTELAEKIGNDAVNTDGDGRILSVFCEAPHVICVSATGPTSGTPFAGPWGNVDAPAPYSNIGKQDITVAAPGGTDFGFVSAL